MILLKPAQLTYFPGSPFARICRVAVIELCVPVEPVDCAFPPGPDMFEVNPPGQVPAFILDDRTVFPTFLILEDLWDMSGRTAIYDPASDRQVLLTLLQMGDAYVAAFYQKWCGLRPVARNAIGHNPAERHIARVERPPKVPT